MSTNNLEKGLSQGQLVRKRFRKHKAAVGSIGVLVSVIVLAFSSVGLDFGAGPFVVKLNGWWPYDWIQTSPVENSGKPTFSLSGLGNHPFGQDEIGRDGFARVMRGTQQSLMVMFILGGVSTLIGVTIGSIAGFYRKWVDALLMRFTDLIITIPVVVVGAVIGRAVGNLGSFVLAVFLGLFAWTGLARLVRGEFLSLREREFVDAARVAGAKNPRIIFKHILPNALGVVIVSATLLMSSAILLETGLSFIGFGVQLPDVSLGLLISENQAAFSTRPWLFWMPGVFIVIIALSINFIGDGLRDAFDPRQTERIKRSKLAKGSSGSDKAAAFEANQTLTNSNQAILEVKKYEVDFLVDGTWYPAVVDMNLSIKSGEVLAIVGESGSGKSSSALGLMGLLAKNARTRGSVLVKGMEMQGATPTTLRKFRGREVAYIFQEPMSALNPVYTIGFQIVETLRAHLDISPAAAKERAIELIGMVEIPNPKDSFNKYPHQLSGGQRQRAMIAQALACNPSLLVADEPTTALDVTVQAEILDLIRNLKDKLNSAVLLITHDMGVVADLADRIMVMKDGVTVEEGTADQVFNKPKHEYTISLLSSVPKLGSVSTRILSRADSSSAPVLSLIDVTVEYPKRGKVKAFVAVDSVSLDIMPGEVLGLVGESGSGKTTVGRAAIGLLPIKSGSISIDGKEIGGASLRDLADVRKSTGIVFQDPASSLNPRLPIGESIGEPLLLANVARGAALDKMVEDLLDKVELPRSYRNRYPHELSGGQRQRVGIARALALSPNLLIADEPTSALDVSIQARFLELLQELQQELKFACLFISHDIAVVEILAHRIAVMQNGKLVEVGTRDQVLNNPTELYTKSLLAAVPVPDPKEQKTRREARAKLMGSIGK
jgi:peptide/nickel transport system ATP-binding protein